MTKDTNFNISFQHFSLEILQEKLAQALSDQLNKFFLYKPFVSLFGYHGAAMLGYLLKKFLSISREQLAAKKGSTEKVWLLFSASEAEINLYLAQYEQDCAIRKLKEAGLVQTTTIGDPPQRHFKLDVKAICYILVSSIKT